MKKLLTTLCLTALAVSTLQAAGNAAVVGIDAEALVPRELPVANGSTENGVNALNSGSRSLLYSQSGPEVNFLASQDFEAGFADFACEAADNFMVPASGWSIESMRVASGGQIPPDAGSVMNVRFYLGDGPGGLPGTLVDQALGVPFAVEVEAVLLITLPTPICLTPGMHYVSVQADQDFDPFGQWFWTLADGYDDTAWINPGGAFGSGTDWVLGSALSGTPTLGHVFELNGTADCGTADTQDLASAFELGQAYPNPFNPSTSINFTMSETAEANLTVYNMAGQAVATLVDGLVQSGQNNVVFDASGLTSGVYFYTLQTNGFTQTNKMVLLK